MPIYVGAQSADVWASQHLFELTGELLKSCTCAGITVSLEPGPYVPVLSWFSATLPLRHGTNTDALLFAAAGAPAQVSGVPPDAFSETGQLWGSPLFEWKVV